MSADEDGGVKRRPLLIGALGVAGLAIVTGVALEAPRIFSLRPEGPYEDLVAGFSDTAAPVRVGRAILAATPDFNAQRTATLLRQRMGRASLADTLRADARDGRMDDWEGWVLPDALLAACALAASNH